MVSPRDFVLELIIYSISRIRSLMISLLVKSLRRLCDILSNARHCHSEPFVRLRMTLSDTLFGAKSSPDVS